MTRLTQSLWAASAVLLVGMTSSAIAEAPSIQLTHFEVTHLEAGKVRIEMTAAGSGIAVGSFCIHLVKRQPEGPLPPEFFTAANGHVYLSGGGFGTSSPNLKDNGPRDEDPAVGAFAVTLDIQKWPPGKYLLSAMAHNRPAAGPYIVDNRPVPIQIGTVSDLSNGGSNIPGAVHRVIYEKEGVYACFPSLTATPDGTLVTSFGTRTRRSHIDPTGGSLRLVSSDGGLTWTKSQGSVIDPRWQTKRGQLVRAAARGWIYTDAEKTDELIGQHKTVMAARPGVVAYLGGAESYTSDDNGKSWQRREIDVPDYVSGLMGYHHTASALATPEGLRLVAVYGRRIDPARPLNDVKTEVFLLRSADDGLTWQCVPMLPEGLPDPTLGFDETAIVATGDGAILALMRSNPEGYLYQAVSRDGGLTWSKPVKTPIWGYPAQMLQLQDGRLLAIYGYRRDLMGIRACISRDHGRTWDIDHELILRADGFCNGGDLGYPLTHQLPDGTLFTIYYHTTDGVNTHIASTHWRARE